MSSSIIPNLTCPDPSKPTPPNNDDLPGLAKSMGLSNTCQQMASNIAKSGSVSASAGASGSASGFGMSAKAAAFAKSQASATSNNNQMNQSGCGQFLLNTNKIKSNSQDISCSMNSNSKENSTQFSANQSISIICKPWADGQLEALKKDQNEALITWSTLVLNLTNAGMSPDFINKIAGTRPSTDLPYNNITNIEASNDFKGKIKTVNTNNSELQSELSQKYEAIANAAAENHMQTVLGSNALSPNVKTMLSAETNTQKTDYNKKINNIMSKIFNGTNINQSSHIEASPPCNFNNIKLSNSLLIDMATSNLTESAIKDGRSSSTKLISSATSKNVSKVHSQGVNDIVAALGKANADAINAGPNADGGLTAGGSSTISTIIGGVVIIFIIMFLIWYLM